MCDKNTNFSDNNPNEINRENKYRNGKIYFIYGEGLWYIGSTIQPLHQRLLGHKSAYKCFMESKPMSCYCSSFIIFASCEKPTIKLIEKYPCKSLKELHEREKYYINQDKSVVNIIYNKEMVPNTIHNFTLKSDKMLSILSQISDVINHGPELKPKKKRRNRKFNEEQKLILKEQLRRAREKKAEKRMNAEIEK